MLNIKISTMKYNVDLNLNDYITLIIGDSGVGKSLLCSFLRDYERLGMRDKCLQGYKIGVADTFDMLEMYINKQEPYVVFIDKIEQWGVNRQQAYNLIYHRGIGERLMRNEKPYYFVISTRGVLGLPYTDKNKVYLEFQNNTFRFSPFKGGVI